VGGIAHSLPFFENKIYFVWQQSHSDYESTTMNSGALAAKKKLLTPPKRVKILPQGYKRFNTATPVGFTSALRDVLS
jgi:hypothetical protein